MVRAVRRGELTGVGWIGSSRDFYRERLVLNDLEQEIVEDILAAPPERRRELVTTRLPWVNTEAPVDEDPDKMYEETLRAAEEHEG